ncbi:LOW QUALITY PROTEIN: hypothetical protein BC936DRAFT_147606 [Jimgerdemannia flammicorona]|uniref:Uncharacterized protein n=1 Tax=Jimgerdemannia flammicorona TaxID=994334 RepID=A0A433DKY0_9FUNG|nr:LOW QUALITY PROTEIN: hypothetical protein BC936DRAFT_147606 [Jimgerdemannia flammicorona]
MARWARWQDGKMSKMARWQDGKTARWQDSKIARWQDDSKTGNTGVLLPGTAAVDEILELSRAEVSGLDAKDK